METLLERHFSSLIPSSLQQSPKSQHWLWSVRASEGRGGTEAQRGQGLSGLHSQSAAELGVPCSHTPMAAFGVGKRLLSAYCVPAPSPI